MIDYHNIYISYSRKDLLKKVSQAMSEKRFNHVLGVEKATITLAEAYGGDLEKASIAALVHDYAKERPDSDFINEIKAHFPQELLAYGNEIWHGVVGADFIERELDISDEEILEAVRQHTVGGAEMSLLSQILYVADYIEEGRNFPGVEEARALAAKDLKAAVAYETKHTLAYLIETERKVYPKTIETYNAWVAK